MLSTGKVIRLSGELVELESFSERHITEEYIGWLRDPEVNRHLVYPRAEISWDEVRTYCNSVIASEQDYFFAILDKAKQTHIGNLRLGPINEAARNCRFGMLIGDRRCHGRGMGTEAVHLAIRFCFSELGLHKIFLDVAQENLAAIKTYEKNGFVTEGVLKDHVLMGGKFCDMRLMGLINPSER